jgi:hypothetical protein
MNSDLAIFILGYALGGFSMLLAYIVDFKGLDKK